MEAVVPRAVPVGCPTTLPATLTRPSWPATWLGRSEGVPPASAV